MGIKISQLETATSFAPSDTVPIQTETGTKQMPMSLLVPNTAEAHNNFPPRGKVLTDHYTLDEIYAMITARNYSDIFVGDKIKVNVPAIAATGFAAATTTMLVGEIESHWNYGDNTSMNKGHLLLVPEGTLGNAKMNATNTTEGAYDGSDMDNTIMPAVQAALETAFGASHLLTAREFLTSVVNTTVASKGVPNAMGCTTFVNNWVDRKCRLMTELEVYGSSCFSSSGEDDRAGLSHQIALFRMSHKAVCNRAAWWLSAVCYSTNFCYVSSYGIVHTHNAGYSLGVRPRFIIG